MHVAIILDGNRRWAKERGLPTFEGHRLGINNAIEIVSSASELGIKFITLYAFSSENWNRSVDEVKYIMGLFEYYFKTKSKKLAEKNIKVQFIGDFTKAPPALKKCMDNLEKKTSKNDGLQLYIAIGYGGRPEIVRAAKKLAAMYKDGDCSLEMVDENFFNGLLYTKDAPYPDLLIRTGGEMRLSNFLLWQAAYSELYFSKKYWPEFSLDDLREAIAEFKRRERRYGL